MSRPLNHLREHKFRQNFLDTLNPLFICVKTLKQHLVTFSTVTLSPTKEASF